jgi:DNA (cytosine-5)-methyltransferase 1
LVNKQSLNELALFAGAGGGILGGHLLGWRTVCAVEWEPYPASVLCARQNEGLLPPFPIWDDIQTFDGKPWRGLVDVVSGGFPCQDISAAGKGVGIDGERSGMWREMARVIREVGPRFVFVENSPMLTSRGLGAVLGDLASMGFDAKWGVLGAADVGANHQRDRIWIVAKWRGQLPHTQHNRIRRWEQQQESIERSHGEASYSDSIGLQIPTNEQELESQGSNQLQVEQSRDPKNVAYTSSQRGQAGSSDPQGRQEGQSNQSEYSSSYLAHTSDKGDVWREWELGFVEQEHNSGRSSINGRREWWATEPDLGRVAHGIPARVDRLKAIGNAQVPLCAATAWRILK